MTPETQYGTLVRAEVQSFARLQSIIHQLEAAIAVANAASNAAAGALVARPDSLASMQALNGALRASPDQPLDVMALATSAQTECVTLSAVRIDIADLEQTFKDEAGVDAAVTATKVDVSIGGVKSENPAEADHPKAARDERKVAVAESAEGGSAGA